MDSIVRNIAAYRCAGLNSRARVELAQKRDLIDKYAQGRVGRYSKL